MTHQRGFSLIELLVALVIVGILAGIAYPSYQTYIIRARRSDGQAALMDLAARMERFYAENNHTYVGATFANLGVAATTPEGFYTLSIPTTSATTYTLNATPAGAQTSDTVCATLTLNQLGQKGETGTGTVAECW